MATEVNPAKVHQAGEDIIADAAKMYESLNKVKNLIDGSKSYFKSGAGDQLRNKFYASAEKFQEFEAFLKKYGEFLETYSGNIESFETAVKEALAQIPTMDD